MLKILIYLTFIFFSLGQLGRISFFGQQINIYLYELLLILSLGVLVYRYRLKPLIKYFPKLKYFYLLLTILFISFLLNFFKYNLFENFVSLLYFVRLLIYLSYFIYVIYNVKTEKKIRRIIYYGISTVGVLTIVSSLVQYFFYPNLRNLGYLGWDPHLYRIFGVFFDSSASGAIFGLLFIYFFFQKKYLFMAIYLIFILFTYSRSLYISLILTIFWFFLSIKKYISILIIIIGFISLVILLPKPFGESVNLLRTYSIFSRVNDYKTALSMWQKNPVFGIGYNHIRYAKMKLNLIDSTNFEITHSGASFNSSYLIILVTGGIIGLLFFLGGLSQLMKLHNYTKYITVFVGTLSFMDNIILHPFILFLFGAMTALFLSNPSDK